MGLVLFLTACLSSPTSGPESSRPRPSVIQISAGGGHALALLSDSTVVSWGRGGELAEAREASPYDPRWVPRRVQGLPPICTVEAPQGAWAMAIACDGTVWTWGSPITPVNGDLGRLGASDQVNHGPVPGQVLNLKAIRDVAGGSSSGFAVDSTGTLFSWGEGGFLARPGTRENRPNPVPAPSPTFENALNIDYKGGKRIVLTNDGEVWTWGVNRYGGLGRQTPSKDGKDQMRSDSIPSQVRLPNDISAVEIGITFGLALRSDSTLWGWGSNKHGQLAGPVDSLSGVILPRQIVSDTFRVAEVVTGGSYSIARIANGQVYGWGINYDGQIGREPIPKRPLRPERAVAHSEVEPINIPKATRITAGGGATLAYSADGTLYSWGSNYYGSLGRPERYEKEPGTATPRPVHLDSAFVRRPSR